MGTLIAIMIVALVASSTATVISSHAVAFWLGYSHAT